MWMELWTRLLMRKGTRVPVVAGVLESAQKNSLDLDWTGVSGYSPGYRLRVDGEHYFIVPNEISLLSSGESEVLKLRDQERIVLAYRGAPSGRRVVAWAFQPQVSLNHWEGDPRHSLRTALGMLLAGLVLLACAGAALRPFASSFSGPIWIMVLGIVLVMVAMLLLGLAVFTLRDLRVKDRFFYYQARREAMALYSEIAQGDIDDL